MKSRGRRPANRGSCERARRGTCAKRREHPSRSRPAPACLLALLVSALSLVPACRADRVFPRTPNVVLILADALRRDHVGAYGHARETTPFLDRLGEHGVVFDDANAQASQTFNSTATLFTSRLFPYRAAPRVGEGGVRMASLAPANLTLAEALKESGYRTFAVFTNPHHSRASGFWQGFAQAEYVGPGPADPYGRAPRVLDAFLGWLDRGAGGSPFFAYLHFMDVHNPYDPPAGFRDAFPAPEGNDLYVNGKPEGAGAPTESDLAFMRSRYDGEIRFLDSHIEELADELASRSLWRDTVVIVTSDHGDEFMEHGGLGHGTSLEKEVVRVPTILHSGGEPIGKRVPEMTRNLDLAPTILEIAGVDVPAEFEGESLVPLVLGAPWEEIPYSFAWVGPHSSVTTSRWHFAANERTGVERLYDNAADPRGLRDVALEHPDVVARFRRIVSVHAEERDRSRRASEHLPSAGVPASSGKIDPEILEQLRALSYVP